MIPHGLLLASVGALAAGPLLAGPVRRSDALQRFLDGFILVSIGGIVLLAVGPHAIQHRSPLIAVALAVGYLLPTAAERVFHVGVRQTHAAVLLLALLGVALHALLDGAALAQQQHAPGGMLGAGVVLHQLPVSLTAWWLLRARARVVSWGVLGLMALATVAGYAAEPAVAALVPGDVGVWLEALVGGSLLHVIVHPAHDHHDAHAPEEGHSHDHAHDHAHDAGAAPPAWRVAGVAMRPDGVGGVLGALLVLLLHLLQREPVSPLGVSATFLSLALDSAPALLLAFVAAGVAYAFIPAAGLSWLRRGGALRQAGAGMLLGLPLPVCSCGVVPLYQGLVKQGVPTAAAVAFLVATPELGIDAVLLSLPLLGAGFTLVRVGAAVVVAVVVALLLARRFGASAPRRVLPQAPAAAPAVSRWRLAVQTGAGEVVDHTAPWILVGLAVAALLAPLLDGSWITRLPPVVDVLVFAALGVPLYICASASTPLVAVLVAAGVSPGAGLALLITGPATNVATFGVLARMHGRPFATAFAVAMTACSVVLGVLVNRLLPTLAFPAVGAADPERHGPWAWGALVLVALLVLGSVARRGPRAFVGELRLTPHHG
jgi:uncharacterized membrane protein YraQ (UPF0718 family)